jgi:hypothetical protein
MKFADPTKLDRKSGGSGGICGSLNQHPLSDGSTTLPFVIPTEPRISYYAAPPTTTYAAFIEESRMKFADPTKLDRKSGGSGGICGSINQHPLSDGSTALPFVIPTEPRISYYAAPPTTTYAAFIEESRMKFADPTKARQEIWGKWRDLRFSQPASAFGRKHHSTLCHPDRSGGICSSLNQHLMSDGSTALPFVIPSAVEGSAVRLLQQNYPAMNLRFRSGRRYQ